jgi:hypothetical protein
VPAIVGALWGSSWHLVSGPTTAISIVVFASISPLAEPGSPQFIGLVLTLTLLAGLIQLAMGLARLGALVNFISHTVIIGFTAGAAILIAGSQIKNFFGLDMPRGAHFHEVLIHSALISRQPWVMTVRWLARACSPSVVCKAALHDRRHGGGQRGGGPPQHRIRRRGDRYSHRRCAGGVVPAAVSTGFLAIRHPAHPVSRHHHRDPGADRSGGDRPLGRDQVRPASTATRSSSARGCPTSRATLSGYASVVQPRRRG